MILYTLNNVKCFETCSGEPNSDWTGSADFIVDETNEQNIELIAKIKEYAPYFDYVTDDSGNLIDVIKTGEKPEPIGPEQDPLEELRSKCSELESQNKLLTEQVEALSGQLDFQEECIVEMAGIVYA